MTISKDNAKKICFVVTIIEAITLLHTGSSAMSNIEAVLRKQEYFVDEIIQSGEIKFNETIDSSTNRTQLIQNYSAQFDEILALKYVPFQLSTRIMSGPIKIIVGFLLDNFGWWYTRTFCHIGSFIGLVLIILSSPTNPNLIGYPIYFSFNIGAFFSTIMLANLYPKNMGLFYTLVRILFLTETLTFKVYKDYLADNFGTYFWVFFLCLQPLIWLRTFLTLPKRCLEVDNYRCGWETRNDPSMKVLKRKIAGEEKINDNHREEPAEKFSLLSYFKDIKQTMTERNILLIIWCNVGLMIGFGLNSQYQSILRWKFADSPHKDEALRKYIDQLNYSFIANVVSVPIYGLGYDFLVKKLKQKGTAMKLWTKYGSGKQRPGGKQRLENTRKWLEQHKVPEVISCVIFMIGCSVLATLANACLIYTPVNEKGDALKYPFLSIIVTVILSRLANIISNR